MIGLVVAALAGPVVEWPLETGDGDFVVGGDTLQWEWGAVENGPGAGYSGHNAWAVGLTADYLNDTTDTLTLPIPDLSEVGYPVLVFHHWYALGAGDAAWIELDIGNGWARAEPFYGYPSAEGWTGASAGWERVGVDLSGVGPTPGVRLVFSADAAGVSDGWYLDDLGVYDGDVVPPRLSGLTVLPDTEDLAGPYAVAVSAADDLVVDDVTLYWTADGVEHAEPMDGGPGDWTGTIPGQAPGTRVDYHVEASDGLNLTSEPAAGDLSFRVYLPAPTGLVGPAGRVLDDVATLSWTPPESVHPVLGYVVEREGVEVAETESPSAEVPLLDGVWSYAVRARFAEGTGDASASIPIDAAVPAVVGLSPAEGYPGEVLRLELFGRNLFLVAGDVAVDLGEDVLVRGVDVRSVDRAVLSVEILSGADPGLPRDLVVTTSSGETRAEGAFQVRPTDEAPRLVSVEPASVRQGERVALFVAVTGPIAGVPGVDLGDGVVVEGVALVEGGVSVTASFARNAPLGAHALTLDDGVRIFEGVSVEVEDVLLDTGSACGCGRGEGAGSGVALVLAGVGLLVRRRPSAGSPPERLLFSPRR